MRDAEAPSLAPTEPFARLTLALLRWHFTSFADPASQGWLRALHVARAELGHEHSAAFCADLALLIETLRRRTGPGPDRGSHPLP